ncbi:MAG TPA: zinc-binding dehydrogenase [Vicinamibacteria bacterium]|nr:zinc-binding dehydrogenase [Vicinamibacteria bacterium]
MKTYRAVMLTGRGGPGALQVVELPLPEPGPGELRVRVRATGIGATDLTMLDGSYAFAPRIPFVPGYEIAGVVDALGSGVRSFSIGQRVAALTVWGGYAEVVVRGAEHFLPIPDTVSDTGAAAVILNHVTAWQMIHRTARVGEAGDRTALVTGAAGGVGTAALQILRRAGVRTLGAASAAKHGTVRALGATPVDSRAGRLDRLVRAVVPAGVDFAFDGIGGASVSACIGATRRGGMVVGYGFAGTKGRLSTVLTVARALLATRLRGRRGAFYGITMLYRRDPRPFREDLPKIFALLAERKIDPLIARRFPLLEARAALELLATGGVEGKIVLEGGSASQRR